MLFTCKLYYNENSFHLRIIYGNYECAFSDEYEADRMDIVPDVLAQNMPAPTTPFQPCLRSPLPFTSSAAPHPYSPYCLSPTVTPPRARLFSELGEWSFANIGVNE